MKTTTNKKIKISNNRKLTCDQIIEVRERRREGEKYTSIADDFIIGNRAISEICNGTYYKDCGGPINGKDYKITRSYSGSKNLISYKRRKLTDDQVVQMRLMRQEGAKERELQALFKIAKPTVNKACRGFTYKDCGGPIAGKDYVRITRSKLGDQIKKSDLSRMKEQGMPICPTCGDDLVGGELCLFCS